MPRLIWVFGGHTYILLVLSCRGSNARDLMIILHKTDICIRSIRKDKANSLKGAHTVFWQFLYIWAATWQKQQNECAPSEDSDQPGHPLCAQWVAKGPRFLMWTAETLIRLGGCPGWSESSLGAHSLCWSCHVTAHFCPVVLQYDLWIKKLYKLCNSVLAKCFNVIEFYFKHAKTLAISAGHKKILNLLMCILMMHKRIWILFWVMVKISHTTITAELKDFPTESQVVKQYNISWQSEMSTKFTCALMTVHWNTKWAVSWQNQQSGMCAQRRLRSAWASAQSDQSLPCPHEESLGP